MRGTVRAWVVSLAAFAAAIALRWLLDPILGDELPLVTTFGAVAAAVWIGGYRPALAVTVLSYLAASYLFIQPRGSIEMDFPRHTVGFIAYLFTCALIIAFGEAVRRAHQQATERREVLRVTLQSIGDAVITTDTRGNVTYLNSVAQSLTGWTLEEAIGQPLDQIFNIINEETRRSVENPASRALRQGVVVGLANHTLLIRKNGGECPIDDSAAPIQDEQGRISGCVLIFRDVTAQRRTDQEKENQLHTARLLASIVESSDDAIVSKSLDGIIQTWNAGAERLFGYRAAEAVGRHISLVIPPDRLPEEDTIIASLKAGERIDHFETERVRSDGRRVIVSLTISPIKDAAGSVIGASKIVRDVTDRKRAEAERERFVTLIESSTDFIAMCDLDGVPFFVNRAGLKLVGLESVEEARRTPVSEFFFAEDRPLIMEKFFPAVLRQGHGEIEIRFRHFKTGGASWMAYKVLALKDAAGRPVAFGTVSQDITQRKELENSLRRLAADLSEANRRKDEFLAMLAHELRNPLAPISNAVQVLRLGEGDRGAVEKVGALLERQVGQMARLVDDLLDMSRITRGRIELRKERTDLARVIHQAVEAAQIWCSTMNHNLTVTQPEEPLTLNADPARLAQVIGNLLNNACKFTDRGGQIHLIAERDGDQAVIRVRDNGIGVTPEQHSAIFDMFTQLDTSLERSRDGLGIGLTLVKTLVEQHGGTVSVSSEGAGRGSEFVVRLPLLVEPVPEETQWTPALTEAVGKRRILIVDDSPDSAQSLAMLLELRGQEAHTAGDGIEALALTEQLRPDVVLLDIGLPRLNGYEVCRRIREQPWGREIVIAALTGWGQEEDLHRSKEAGFTTHLVKPVDLPALMKLLASLPGSEAGIGR